MRLVHGKKGEGEADPKMSLGSMILVMVGVLVVLFILFMVGKQINKVLGLF